MSIIIGKIPPFWGSNLPFFSFYPHIPLPTFHYWGRFPQVPLLRNVVLLPYHLVYYYIGGFGAVSPNNLLIQKLVIYSFFRVSTKLGITPKYPFLAQYSYIYPFFILSTTLTLLGEIPPSPPFLGQ